MAKLKKLLIGALSMCMAISMAACGNTGNGDNSNGGNSTTGGSESKLDGKKTDFTLQIFTGGYGADMWKYVIKAFEADHPEYNVVANMSNTVNENMKDDWKDGNPPDFVFLDGTLEKQAWLENDMLYDFTDWLETATVAGEENVKIKDRMLTEYVHEYKNEAGKTITYGMPLALSSYGMWYDNALFSRKGWTVPANYSELSAWVDKNATAETAALIYPGKYSGYLVQGMILPALAEVGDEFYNRVENALDAEVYTSAEFKAVMNRFADVFGKGKKANSVADCISLDHTTSQMQWLAHKAAFIPNGLWLRKEMAALEFMRYLYRSDVVQKFAECTDSPSATNVALDESKVSEVLKYAQEVMSNPAYKHVLHVGSWGGVDSVFNQGVNSIVAGTKTVDQVCNDLAAQARKQLNG